MSDIVCESALGSDLSFSSVSLWVLSASVVKMAKKKSTTQTQRIH
jgi:hypothetical protein